jgi:hypothetical protein
MILIAYNQKGYVISIVVTKSMDLANAYWQGAGIFPHSIKNVDDPNHFIPLSEHTTGVYPILKTDEFKPDPIKDITYIRVTKS